MTERQDFYNSKLWKQQRRYIWLKQNCTCYICKRPVYCYGISDKNIPKDKRLRGIVHHIKWLDNTNINEDAIALDEANLIGICIDCHNAIHKPSQVLRTGLAFDENGNLIQVKDNREIEQIERLKQQGKL